MFAFERILLNFRYSIRIPCGSHLTQIKIEVNFAEIHLVFNKLCNYLITSYI